MIGCGRPRREQSKGGKTTCSGCFFDLVDIVCIATYWPGMLVAGLLGRSNIFVVFTKI